ncbi:type IVB secretion system protein IcmH/DotU [Desulfobacterales bacterium HSG16]|nr:type IVB secretion system protein IcmH/DotU [Desulfobacterales bacterium HSG16]
MCPSDPFDFDNNSVVRPRPGGIQASRVGEKPFSPTDIWDSDLQSVQFGRSNLYITNSFSILSLAPKIRSVALYEDTQGLYKKLVDEINEFEKYVLSHGISEADARTAKLFLCALLDESVLNTPWGFQSSWKHVNLSSRFFKQMLGERFFDEVEILKRQSRKNLELLKLAYVCLSLGFQGKYRPMSDGKQRAEEDRLELYALIEEAEDHNNRNLSIHWKGRPVNNPLIRYVPMWVISSVACIFLLLSFTGFLFFISISSDSVYDSLIDIANAKTRPISAKKMTISEPIPKPPPVVKKKTRKIQDQIDRFKKLLAREISKGMVKVIDGPIIRISNTFPSGKAEIKKEFHSILEKVADEVKDDTSRIEVHGHTDSQRIRFSIQFPDNHRLSEARAESAEKIMLKAQPSLEKRISTRGKGYSERIVPNDTKTNRATNRRIDIHIR